jgi:hypothetical protein
MAARIDSQAYAMGAKRMENIIPMMTGGCRKRPGTWYAGNTKNDQPARLIEWMLSDGSCVILEVTTGTIRVWKDDNTVSQEIITSYTQEQIAGIKYAASANSLWLVHSKKRPYKIARDGTNFVLTEPGFTGKNFATTGNFPGAIAFNSGRLCFAGTDSEPNRIYMSMAPNSITGEDRYTNFTAGENPADAIVLEENDMHGGRLQWIAANRRMLAATERATWSDTGEVPTPSTFDMNIIEYAGANELQAQGTKEILVYAGRSGKTLRALVWNQTSESAGFADVDITEQAAHLCSSGIKDFSIADYPYPIIWIVNGNGELISCTVNIRAGVLAYARHPTDGSVESVAVAQRKDGDVLYMTVKRGDIRNIEYLILEDLINTDIKECHYVDSGEHRKFDMPTKTITGLERFAGKIIRVFADGAAEPPVTVSENGTAELQVTVSEAHIGLPYKSVLSPNTPQIPANGTSLGKKRRIEKAMLKLYKSLGGRVGVTEEKSELLITQRYGSYDLGSAPEPFTGDIDITVSGNIDYEGKLIITHEEPVPFTLLALVEHIALLET